VEELLVNIQCFCLCSIYSHGDGLTYPVQTVDEDHHSLLGQRQRWAEEGEGDTDDNTPSTSHSNYDNSDVRNFSKLS